MGFFSGAGVAPEEADGHDFKNGLVPNRGCTDIICVFLFIGGWVVFIIVTLAGFADGDPAKLYMPRDFSGAYCGSEKNWNSDLNLLDQKFQSYTMNVSHSTDVIAKQMICSSVARNYLVSGINPETGQTVTVPLTVAEQDEYMCACCYSPCARCSGSLSLGGDLSTASSLSATSSRMSDLSGSASGSAADLFNPSGSNGDYFSNMWNQATAFFHKVCLPDCTHNAETLTNGTAGARTYTYEPSPDDDLKTAWGKLKTSSITSFTTPINTAFTFTAYPLSVCPYNAAYCVPFQGVVYKEVTYAPNQCSFEVSSSVTASLGDVANTFADLALNDFASSATESLGTWVGDFFDSIPAFIVVSILSFVIGLIFLVLLRFCVGICVWSAMFAVLFFLLLGGGLVFVRSDQCQGASLFDTGKQTTVAVTVTATTAASNAASGTEARSEACANGCDPGTDYRGVQARTRSGLLCQDWSSDTPHAHNFNGADWTNTDQGLEANYCRNPYPTDKPDQKAPTIWCYTTDAQKRWETCSPVGVISPECPSGYAVEGQTARDVMKVCAVIIWILAALWLITMICFKSRISLAIGLNQVAAMFVQHNPRILVVPIVQAVIGIIWVLIWALCACFLLSQVPDGAVPKTSYATYAEAYGTTDTPGKCTDAWPTGEVFKDDFSTDCINNQLCYRCIPPRYAFDVRFALSFFMFLWNNAFMIAVGQCTIAGAVGIWFFTPNDSKSQNPCIKIAVKNCFRYHLGSLAFGAFILALVQFIRYVLFYLEQQFKAQKNRVMQLLMKCLQYLMWCFEKCIKFLNKNAYIQVALKGTNFCTSAKKAFSIILANFIRFGIVAVLGKGIHAIGMLFIMAGTVIVGYFIVVAMNPDLSLIVPMLSYVCVGYIVATLYMNVFGMAVDTSLQCVIVAEEMKHDGSFVPGPLQGILKAEETKAAAAKKAEEADEAAATTE